MYVHAGTQVGANQPPAFIGDHYRSIPQYAPRGGSTGSKGHN